MFVLARAVTYASLFIGLLLVFLPGRILERSGVRFPDRIGPVEVAGLAVTASGAILAVWCVVTFAVMGRGTPAPFDPPRRLVLAGPYRYVRNPMYLGAGLALAGAALFYRSLGLLGYAAAFLIVMQLFVLWYEEPALAQRFGREYQAYRQTVHRWIPRRPTRQ
ncbi:MAG TPA: isoprenylcysteine carboxylmethyltransferase family protein [Gemmatimonadales bacterium]|nr:isoprenylcysteine carboxylmethyltransferase family protein [Gemmatimonadales bacterium]